MNLVPYNLVDGAGTSGQIVGFRPEHIEVGSGRGDSATFNARIEVVEYLGDEQIAHLLVRDTPVVAKLPVEQRLTTGEPLDFFVLRDKLRLFDEENGERLRR
jgi:ABC-type sugar transport system ATPase subunit